MSRALCIGGFVSLVLGAIGGLFFARSIANDLRTPRDPSTLAYAGSDACRTCHPQHHDSWHRTFHRTMTQVATPASVLGDFEHGALSYGGIHARLHRDQDRYVIDFSTDGGGKRWRATVERTVGSHRIQQYLARDGDTWFRLPVAWDVDHARFLHLNGAFLTPDPTLESTRTSIDRADYDRHVTRWNDNCVFCHNVAPNPGLRDDGRFETTTAELGVACEACHGPGDEHVRINSNPLRRYALHLSTWIDPTIANPAQMSGPRQSEVCGRCHGQRKTNDIDRVLREGDHFVPGTDLSHHSTPLARDTTLNGKPDVFAARFWKDGTPRLTAYEYQGLLQSPCAVDDNFSCGSCHAMHDSDPNLQLRRDLQSDNAQCTQCHDELDDEQQASKHSRHDASSSGNQCRACHTPDVVYGLIAARISHRIETPDPADNAQHDRPDACTLCHVTRTRRWAIDALGSSDNHNRDNTNLDDESAAISEVAARLFGGDPIERSIAAAALGRHDDGEDNRAQRIAWLLNTLAHDRYPAVRHIARRSLLQLMRPQDQQATLELTRYDATEIAPDKRREVVTRIAQALGNPPLAPLTLETIDALRSRARNLDIEIGE